MSTYQISVLECDGIGPEIVRSAVADSSSGSYGGGSLRRWSLRR